MKVKINDTTYTAISRLSFAPEADITGNRTPINEFDVDVMTRDAISTGQYAELYDDTDGLWANYWIIYAEKLNENTVRVIAQSILKLLERDMKDPVMYTAEPLPNVLDDIFEKPGASVYLLDSSLQSATLTGFCPEQSAKTRLQWVCFAIGAYVKTAFTEKVEILPVSGQETLIPIEKTFWKPAVTYKDYVTAIAITAFTFTQGTPSTTDEWVYDGTNHYIVERQKFTLNNDDAPETALTNVITFDDVMLINQDNVASLLSFFALYYFRRMTVELDVVNNAEYVPGDRVIAYTSGNTMAVGYIDLASFSFGVQSRSRITLTPVEERECAMLTVTCKYTGGGWMQNAVLDVKTYVLPVGYGYEIGNPYIDMVIGTHRYIFRPTTEAVSGTMVSGGASVIVEYKTALDYRNGILHIVSVDEAAEDGDTVEIA